MAGGVTNYLESRLLDWSVNRAAVTGQPTKVWCGLFTATPSDTGGGTEVSGGAYARVDLGGSGQTPTSVFGAPNTGVEPTTMSNASDIVFPTATASWGTITQVGIFDASTAGNLLWWGDLTASKVVNNGDVFKFLTGQLVLTLT